MKKIALALTTLMLLFSVSAVYAHDKDKDRGEERNEVRFELRTENHEDGEDEDEDNEFKIRGQVESIADGSFVVNGQTIYIDVTQVKKFKQKGILDVGDWVKVKGIVKDDKNYAEDINVIGEGQGQFMLKIKGLFGFLPTPSASPSPTPSSSASPTPEASASPTPESSASPTPSGSASPTPSVSPSPTTTARVSVKAQGPIDLVTSFLQQVLAYLQGLL
ncbi:hypothetical protein A3E46_00520 [Candidatus Woesebacteria bacterium RIFCSPHIGHO2_12_FULL_46_16]|uniref:DUF5666 domain-containing protein n=1 Tax=Candidatus Woesebacteria bacterium RIFCSPHIGHO2_12_FULL_46_16 TaxID=1802513 RepID=A0A1F8B249_9BACT|nr:MAG: hypothetical protein A3E46_00520 [Candidatus Woesebacteria bacterium RIFCSPHIGHO2_12_FULL_46_16]